MKLKKKYLALVIVVMLALTAVVSTMVYGSVQATRIAYVAVQADKKVFEAGENVTFRLIPMSSDIRFTVSGYYYSDAGMHVIRIPDWIDPETMLDDPKMVQNISSWEYGGGMRTVIPFPEYNSSGEPLAMSWNGSIYVQSPATGQNGTWAKASSGYYLLYPKFDWVYGNKVKFMLDESAIFRYESITVEYDMTALANGTSVAVGLTLPSGFEGATASVTAYMPSSHVGGSSSIPGSSYHDNITVPSDLTISFSMFTDLTYHSLALDMIVDAGGERFASGFRTGYAYSPGGESYQLYFY